MSLFSVHLIIHAMSSFQSTHLNTEQRVSVHIYVTAERRKKRCCVRCSSHNNRRHRKIDNLLWWGFYVVNNRDAKCSLSSWWLKRMYSTFVGGCSKCPSSRATFDLFVFLRPLNPADMAGKKKQMFLAKDWRSYRYSPTVREIRLYAENIVISDLNATALWIIQMQIPNLNRGNTHTKNKYSII